MKKKSSRQAIHITDHYGKKGEPAGPDITVRLVLDEQVAAGSATIGQIAKDFGDGLKGLGRVARMVRLGHWRVPGFSVGALAGKGSISGDERKALVNALKQLPPVTKVIEVSPPSHLTKLK